MFCKCHAPLMPVYSDASGWQAVCMRCGHSGPLSTPPDAGLSAARKAFSGWNLYGGEQYEAAEAAFRSAFADKALPAYGWAALLCSYGVKYLEEPSFFGGMDYVVNFWKRDLPEMLVCDTADHTAVIALAADVGAQHVAYYRAEAELIDHVLRQIRMLAADGEVFDVFISYKHDGSDGNTTPEMDLMQHVARHLEARRIDGRPLRVFFAPATLGARNLPVSDFGGWIHTALRSARLMVLIASQAEYAVSPWVRSEWQRFLRWNSDSPHALMTCTVDPMTPSAFPGRLRKYQTQLCVSVEQTREEATAKWFASEIYQRLSSLPAQAAKPAEPAKPILPDPPAAPVPAETPYDLYRRGHALLYGLGTPRSTAAACDSFSDAATAGSPHGLYMNGHCIRHGIGTDERKCSADECFARALPQLRTLAGKGDRDARYLLGMAACFGDGMPVDAAAALHLLTDAHLPEADHLLAQGYAEGWFGPADTDRAAALHASAAAQGFTPSVAAHAVALLNDPSADAARAVAMLEDAAALNDPDAQHALGEHLLPQAPERAVELFTRAAAQGHAPAINAIGRCYMSGTGLPRDIGNGAFQFSIAAEAGFAPACFNYAKCLFEGHGTPRDPAEAFRMFTAAADGGIDEAHYHLGECLLHGIGTKRDVQQAISHYRKAEAAGCADAMYRLGMCCLKGEGTAKDPVWAIEHFRKAAARRHAPSRYMLGEMALQGLGCPQNMFLALFYLRKAARSNYIPALRRLSECCRNGWGMPAPDPAMARHYADMADQLSRNA